MNKLLNFPSLLLLGAVLLVFSSCKKDDPEPINEEELITTVKMVIKDNGTTVGTYTWKDLDGDGSGAPVLNPATINLAPSKTYNVSLELLNESENPVEDITEEIKGEKEEHQFFFQTTSLGYNLFSKYFDLDANLRPVGLEFEIKTQASNGTGKFKVILRHEPNKGASGVNSGDITNAGGATDVEAEFNVTIGPS